MGKIIANGTDYGYSAALDEFVPQGKKFPIVPAVSADQACERAMLMEALPNQNMANESGNAGD